MNTVKTDVLKIAFLEGGPATGPRVLLLHGWPDDVRGWRQVTPYLEAAGYRWVAPWLRGCGDTTFLSEAGIRDGSGVALAHDAIALTDLLGWERFAVIGHDWGARAAYTLAALYPERIASIAALALGYAPRGAFELPVLSQCRRWWYQWLMTTAAGAQAVRDDPRAFARIQWETWSPPGWFDDAEFLATAASFDNPDWSAVTLHAYRSRWMTEPGDARYDAARQRLAAVTRLGIPTLMIQGGADGCDPASESADQQKFFEAGYTRVVLDGIGHFPAREEPRAVADELISHLQRHRP